MSFWQMIQIVLNVVFIASIGIIFVRLNRPQKDDPRMSRGLQLLQSKISVLEDLSDRTESQVNHLSSIIDSKTKELQRMIEQAEHSMNKIDQGIDRSLEVAHIFQDKIPHQEFIDRQNTIKFVKAAKMAHQGFSAQEIARQVNLTMAEIEFIIKVNKDQLSFDETQLPEWIQSELSKQPNEHVYSPHNLDFVDHIPQKAQLAIDLEKESQVSAQLNQFIEKVTTLNAPPALQEQPKNMAGRIRELGIKPVQFEKISIPKHENKS